MKKEYELTFYTTSDVVAKIRRKASSLKEARMTAEAIVAALKQEEYGDDPISELEAENIADTLDWEADSINKVSIYFDVDPTEEENV